MSRHMRMRATVTVMPMRMRRQGNPTSLILRNKAILAQENLYTEVDKGAKHLMDKMASSGGDGACSAALALGLINEHSIQGCSIPQDDRYDAIEHR